MRTVVPEKILKIVDDIATNGCVRLTRLTVLKKWFEKPERLKAFGLWVARRAVGRPGKTKGDAKALLAEAKAVLGTSSKRDALFQNITHGVAHPLLDQARVFHSEYEKQRWGRVRVIHCWPILLVEKGLAIHLGQSRTPSEGYDLAASWARNYDPRHGDDLNGPSAGRLQELVQFMFSVEALEDEE